MRNNIFAHCTDTAALVAELLTKYPDRVDNNDTTNPKFLIDKAPGTIRNGNETLTRMYVTDDDLVKLNTLDSLNILGTWEEINADSSLREVYDRVYDQTPVEFTDDDGTVSTYTPPEQFVVFSL